MAEAAKLHGTTRSIESMEKAAAIEGPVIFAIGNAPTALVQLYDMIQEKRIAPALVIGVPVGFVNVVQAKERIMQADVPYIVARGRKGGSNGCRGNLQRADLYAWAGMMLELYVEQGGRRLRCGYTTGACAAAAAKAAAELLLSGCAPQTVSINTPKGVPAHA